MGVATLSRSWKRFRFLLYVRTHFLWYFIRDDLYMSVLYHVGKGSHCDAYSISLWWRPISCCIQSRGAAQRRAPLLIFTDTLTFPNGIHSLRRLLLKNMRVDDLFRIPSLANIVFEALDTHDIWLYGSPKLFTMKDWASHTSISESIIMFENSRFNFFYR